MRRLMLWTLLILPLSVMGVVATVKHAQAMTLPTLPAQVTQQTIPTITGSTFTATTCGNLKTALDNAAAANLALNHVVNITAGLTCTLPFLPAHAGPGWIIVRTANFASLPPAGTRVQLSDAANMPTFSYGVATNPYSSCGDEAAMSTAPGANFYWLEGIQFLANTACPGCNSPNKNFALIETGQGVCTVGNTGHIYFSHVIARDADPNHATVRAWNGDMLNGSILIIDSYCSGIKATDADTQCIFWSSNRGPSLIQNNYLEATGENIMFSEQSNSAADLPQDITIRLNLIEHNLAYKTGSNIWLMKTLLELKLGVRVLVEANVFQNTWAGTLADTGHAFRFTVRSWGAASTCYYPTTPTLPVCPQTFAAVQDFTFRYNTIRHIGGGWSMFSSDDGNGGNSQGIARWWIHDNIWTDMGGQWDPSCTGSCGTNFDWNGGGPYPATDILFDHNTFYNDHGGRWFNMFSGAIGTVSGGPVGSNPPVKTADSDWILRNNIMIMGTNGIVGTVNGPGAIDAAFGTGALPNGYQVTNNAVIGFNAVGASMATYSPGPRFQLNCYGTNGSKDSTGDLTFAGLHFDNPGDLDTSTFVITSGPFKAGGACQATDGTDQGVNWTAFNAAQGGGGGNPTPPAAPTNFRVQ